MISETRTNYFEGSDGFTMEIIGFSTLRYSEGTRTMLIGSETLAGPSGMAVYQDSIRKWDPPYDGDIVTDTDRNRIVQNIRDVFRFIGFEIEVM